jgi:hypothetical protein
MSESIHLNLRHLLKENFHMIQFKLMCAISVLVLFVVYAGATPIAMSRISTNFPAAEATFDNQASFSRTVDYPSSYVRLDADGFGVQESSLSGNGVASLNVPGASAISISDEVSLQNSAQVTLEQRYADPASFTDMWMYYDVANVSTIAFSLDFSVTMNLLTGTSQEFAQGGVDEYLELYTFDYDGNRIDLEASEYSITKSVNGEDFVVNDARALNFSHDFGNDPFSGQLVIHGSSQALAGAETRADVPEPTVLSLLMMGVGSLVCIRKKILKK